MNTQEYISSGVIEAYVMGIASDEEVQILECIQRHNLEVRQAVINKQKAIENLVTDQAVNPPPHLKSKIWEAIQTEETKDSTPIQVDESILKPLEIQKNTVKPYKIWGIAASVALVLGISAVGYLYQKQGNLENHITALNQQNNTVTDNYSQLLKKWSIVSNPKMKIIVLTGVKKHSGTKAIVYMDKSTKQTYLSIENLPVCPVGHTYQLWAIVDGKPVDAGIYNPSEGVIQKMRIISNAQAFAITLEKEGGSLTPTMEQMYVMGKV